MKKISFLVFWILILSDFAFADVSTNNNAQGILKIFADNAEVWKGYIRPYAYSLFYFLVVIDWVYTFSMMALRGTDFNEIMAGMVQKVFIIGFFMVMFSYSHWIDTIPKSFSQMANSMTSIKIQPDTILEQGYKIVAKLWEGVSWYKPGNSLGLMISGVIILFSFIVMTANLFMVKVKLYFLILGSYFMLAMGGLGYTRAMGVSGIIAVFKAGLELFFITLILGFSVTVIHQMAANVATDNNSVMAMIGTSMLIAYLTSMVGGLVESLTTGTLGGNGNLAGGVKSSMQGAAQGAVGGSTAAISGVAAANMSQVSAASAAANTGSSSQSTGVSTGKIGNFMKSSVAGVAGAAAGAASGAIKGMVGIGTHNAGSKSGSGTSKSINAASTAAKKILGNDKKKDTPLGEGSSNLANGTISKGSESKSSYVSGVPSGSGSKNDKKGSL